MCLTIDASKDGMVASTLGQAADTDASDPCTDRFKERPRAYSSCMLGGCWTVYFKRSMAPRARRPVTLISGGKSCSRIGKVADITVGYLVEGGGGSLQLQRTGTRV